MRGLAGILVAAAVFLAAPVSAQVQMPNAREMSGRVLPVPDLPVGTVAVRVIRAGPDGNTDLKDQLVELLRGVAIKVNLIPMNPIDGSSLRAPAWSTVLKFQERLRARRISAFVRRRRGDEIDAACGQLALRGETRKRPASRLQVVS